MHKRVEQEEIRPIFWVELVEEVDNKQDSLFLFSSYRTVNVVPFYLAVFPYFVVIIHEKS